ncbi:DNRLRE domain-containing protein [Actinacidiphila bryophytorum]|uniref:DNRLRE domain-containing protein n=1 Tax=Actinacidiphila bryophytorum TaxID=1436133 RepID=UPI002176D704|nr:DNRLRE domain-containing protein [Actinacidiphila bryophytorum]UWE12253.1 DNRLRE domain-containing protein [Actinacidiphila bryophytorum]
MRGRRVALALVAVTALTTAFVPAGTAFAAGGQRAHKPAADAGTAGSGSALPGVDQDAAKAVAKAKDTGKPVEVLSRRTETGRLYANPDGTYTQEESATAQRVRKGNALVDIDPTLQAGSDGLYHTKATEVGLEFSGGGNTPLATITRDGRSLSLSWPKPLPKPVVDGNSATYPEVLPGVDLAVQAGSGGFSELLVVKNAQAAANPALASISFAVAANGVTVGSDPAGNLSALNPAGQQVFTAPTPRMWDSSTPSTATAKARAQADGVAQPAAKAPADAFTPADGARQSEVPIDVSPKQVTLTPDQKLLKGEGVTYPVYIDPAVSGAREAWTIVDKAFPTATFYNGSGWGSSGTTLARVGHEDDTDGTARSFFRMDSNNLWNTAKQVVSSTFRIKNSWSWSCSARSVETWLTDGFSSATSWNQQPDWATKLDTVNDAKGYSSSCPGGNLAFDVTAAAKKAVTNHFPNITLGLRATSETDTYAWKKFDAGSAVLSTTYNTYPGKPSGLYTSPSSGANCGTSTPYTTIGNTDVTLGGTFTDPDGGTVKAHFVLWAAGHDTGTHVDTTVSVTSGKAAKLVVAKATLGKILTDNAVTGVGTFAWYARTEDGSLNSAWASVCHFNLDQTRPSTPPGVVSTQFPDGSDGWPAETGQARTAGTFTLSSGGVADVASYEYWSDWDPTTRTATPSAAGGSYALTLTPPAAGAHLLTVRSLDKAGNRSDLTGYHFYAEGSATPDKPGDLNGDGISDMYAVYNGGTLLLYAGQGNGYLAPFASGGNTDFSGASLTHHGDWTADGYEDLVALMPGGDGMTLDVFPNNGSGFACTARDEQGDGASRSCAFDEQQLDVLDPADNHFSDAQQVVAVGDVDGPLDTDNDGTVDVPGHTDLVVREGGLLWLYFGADGNYLDQSRPPVLIGTSSWDHYDILAGSDRNGDGHVDLVARDRNNGDLWLYPGTGINGEGLGNSTGRSKIGTNWTPANRPLVAALPDTTGDGKSDLLATGGDGNLYLYSNMAGGGVEVGFGGWTPFESLA